jgi:AcrR family transcriptional regulator
LDRLLTAAQQIMAEPGLENARVQDITERADVGKGTFFSYFPSKEHILPMLLERYGDMLNAALTRARDGESVATILVDLRRQNPAVAARRDATFFGSCFGAVWANESVRDLSAERLDVNRGRLERLLAIGQQRQEIRRDINARDLSRMMQELYLGACLLSWMHGVDFLSSETESTLGLFQSLIEADPPALNGNRRRVAKPALHGLEEARPRAISPRSARSDLD